MNECLGVWATNILLTIFGFPLKTARCGYVNRQSSFVKKWSAVLDFRLATDV